MFIKTFILVVSFFLFSFYLQANDTRVIQQSQFLINHDMQLILTNADVEAINDTLNAPAVSILLGEIWLFTSPI